MTVDPQSGIGSAWFALSADLQEHLRERDPSARVEATINATGLLQLDVRTRRDQRAASIALARRYQETASWTCERCGGRVSVVAAGPVVTILCKRCS